MVENQCSHKRFLKIDWMTNLYSKSLLMAMAHSHKIFQFQFKTNLHASARHVEYKTGKKNYEVIKIIIIDDKLHYSLFQFFVFTFQIHPWSMDINILVQLKLNKKDFWYVKMKCLHISCLQHAFIWKLTTKYIILLLFL